MKMNGKFQQLTGSVDHLTQRVGRLAEQLVTETAASRLTRWASQHPPRSDFVRQLAEGNTGSVHEVNVTNRPGAKVAVKRIDWSSHEQRQSVAKRVATEISVLQSLKHPLLPELHQVYTTGNELCLEMTLCQSGTLWHQRQELGGTLPLELVRQYTAELVCVLTHLHDNGVIYVDLKPENVLLQDCGHIMLCDMDLAHTLQEIDMIRQMDAVNPQSGPVFWGTLVYVAPEVAIAGAGAYSISSDWWSVGVLMYELLLGLVPWDAPDDDGILEQIKQGDVLWPPEGLVDAEAEDLMRGLLTWDPNRRLGSSGVHQIMQHPFFATVDWTRLVSQVERDQQRYATMQAAALEQQQQQRL